MTANHPLLSLGVELKICINNRRWDLIKVFTTTKGQNRHLEGKCVEQIAKDQSKGIMDAFL